MPEGASPLAPFSVRGNPAMRVLHVPYGYFPDPPGGTEVYVANLAAELTRRGIGSVVAAPTHLADSLPHLVDGVPVRRIAIAPLGVPLSTLYGGDPRLVDGMLAAVREVQPDVVHFHAYTPAINGAVARAVRGGGTPVVVTYHSPTVTCQRGTLVRFGRTICDGTMLVGRCSACVLQQHGVPRPVADMLGRVPVSVGRWIQRSGNDGGPWTALQMSALMEQRHRDAHAYLDAADVVVAVSRWVQGVLELNGVDASRIVLSPQGVSRLPSDSVTDRPRAPASGPGTRAVMLGRLDWTKGMHVPLEVLARNPDLDLAIDIYGTAQHEDDYVRRLRALADRDARVRLLPPIPPSDVVRRIADYDVTLVPSQWLETGPLVVLESFAAGVPVVGSNLGGIPERVRDGVDGLLVAPDSASEWERALRSIVNDPTLLGRWRKGITPPRVMGDVAEDMARIYERVARPARCA